MIFKSKNTDENVQLSHEILDCHKVLFMALVRFSFIENLHRLTEKFEFDTLFFSIFFPLPNYHHKTKLLLLIFSLTAPFFFSVILFLSSDLSLWNVAFMSGIKCSLLFFTIDFALILFLCILYRTILFATITKCGPRKCGQVCFYYESQLANICMCNIDILYFLCRYCCCCSFFLPKILSVY